MSDHHSQTHKVCDTNSDSKILIFRSMFIQGIKRGKKEITDSNTLGNVIMKKII